jgi:hypothetical protein
MTQLAQCMSRLWSGGTPAKENTAPAALGTGTTVKL